MNKTVILQPHYIPYSGTLALINECDTFVIYDDIQFSHQSWQHRNRIRNQNDAMWLTVPVIRKEGQLINEVMIDNTKNWNETHWKSIKQSYSRTPYFNRYSSFEDIYKERWNKLIDLDIVLMGELAAYSKIKMPHLEKSSSIPTSGSKVDRLIPILKAVNADVFIEGIGGKNYIDEIGINQFKENGIDLMWFEYQHPVYPQNGQFISHLSSLDLLFNTGDSAIEYIRQGVNLKKAE